MKKACLFFCALSLMSFSFKDKYEENLRYTSDTLDSVYTPLQVSISWDRSLNILHYSYPEDGVKNTYIVDLENNKFYKAFDKKKFVDKFNRILNRQYTVENFNLGFIEFDQKNTSVFYKDVGTVRLAYNTKTGRMYKSKIPEIKRSPYRYNETFMNVSPDSSRYIYAFNDNLYSAHKGDTTNVVQLSFDGANDHSFASSRAKQDQKTSPFVQWSGDSKYFYKLIRGTRDIKDLWVINHLDEPRPTLKTYKFPMPGEQSAFQYDFYIYSTDSNKLKKIDISKYPDQEVKVVRFDFDSQSDYVYLTRKSRTCDKFDLLRVSTLTGKVFEVISETSKPSWTRRFIQVNMFNQGDDIIWWSERSGYGHFYLYNKEGECKSQITSGDLVAWNIERIDTLGRKLIFSGYGGDPNIDPNYKRYFSVNFDGSDQHCITPENADHQITFSPDNQFFYDEYSTVDVPPTYAVRNIDGTLIKRIEHTDLSPLYATGWQAPQKVQINAADDSTILYGVMFKPFDFDSTKQYPIIACVYPGPQEDYLPMKFALDHDSQQKLSQMGCIVVNISYRGSNNRRGHQFHSYGYGNLRDYALPDCKYAIEQLGEQFDFIDLDHVGIYGHSGGGFMATTAILTYPDFFKVAIGVSGNYDNNIYTQWWGETHHGVQLLQDSLGSHFESKIPTTIELADNLKGKLMLITGDIDINVHMANSLRMANALIKADKEFDFFVFPGFGHGMGGEYYDKLIARYFYNNLITPSKIN